MGVLAKIRNIFQTSPPEQSPKIQPVGMRPVRGRYDAAQTINENLNHWSNTDALSPNASTQLEVRKKLRERSRYEVANNCYAYGIIQTHANYVVGTGPRIQLRTDNAELNALIEREWSMWSESVGLADLLQTMRVAQADSGEVFMLLVNNPNAATPVQLDLVIREADYCTTPWNWPIEAETSVDGMVLDALGRPVQYVMLRQHPGDLFTGAGAWEYDLWPAAQVIHLFRPNRPGQLRGIPELTPALPLFSMMRDYTLAVLNAAQQAALPGGVIQSDAPAETGSPTPIAAMDEVELERGMWFTMPMGWKLGQVKAEQPVDTYEMFKKCIITEVARCFNMPYNVAAGSSENHNYASGRLDHQAYFRWVKIDRKHLERAAMDRLFNAWFAEATRISGYLPQSARRVDFTPQHVWHWDGFGHVDPLKEATAQQVRLMTGTTTLAEEYASLGRDWEESLRQRAREIELARELGVPEVPVSNETVSRSQSEIVDDE